MVFYVYARIFGSSRKGKRVTSISYGDTHIQYAPINLADLLKLRSQIKAGLSETNPRKRQVIFSTSKGVR